MSIPADAVRLEVAGPVATVVLHRPHARNAVDGPTAAALEEAFAAIEADDEVAAAVLWGAGGTFCAGADLKAVGTDTGNALHEVGAGPGPMGPSRRVLSKPVIAAIEGYAVAGGLELAAWCDLRVASRDAVLGVFCRRWGVPLIDGGTVRLPRIIGEGRALDLILTGRAVGAEEAERMGLVNRLVKPGEARAAAEQLARELAALPQTCLRGDLAAAREQWGRPEAEALAVEWRHGMRSLAAGALDGARRFADGAGRHGASD